MLHCCIVHVAPLLRTEILLASLVCQDVSPAVPVLTDEAAVAFGIAIGVSYSTVGDTTRRVGMYDHRHRNELIIA